MRFKNFQLAALVAAGALLSASPALKAADSSGTQGPQSYGRAVITVLPAERPGEISPDDLHLKIGGQDSSVTRFTQLQSPQNPPEIVVLIDEGARSSLGTQLSSIATFIQRQMPATKVAVAYMQNGRAVFAGPLTTDHQAAVRQVHMSVPGMAGISASPYFCLSDLAKHWPSSDARARREVVMITDGVDNYDRRYDPDDPYVQSAMADAARAHLVVYSIYWRDQGRFDRTMYAADSGQNLLAELTAATGGVSYWNGLGNPVDFEPYFADINRRIDNQYELDFTLPRRGKPQVESFSLKASVRAKIQAPQQAYVQSGAE